MKRPRMRWSHRIIPVGGQQRVLVGQRHDAGAEPDVPGLRRHISEEDHRIGDDLAAGRMVLADPGLVIGEPVDQLDRLEITLERDRHVLGGRRIPRRHEDAESDLVHFNAFQE
nr:hypothetical protein [Chenggangzhangella methanolivorans]